MSLYTPPKSGLLNPAQDKSSKSQSAFRKIIRIVLTFIGMLIWLLLALFSIPDNASNGIAVHQIVASSVSIIFSFINFFLLSISLVIFGNRTLIFSKFISVIYIGFVITMFLILNGIFTQQKVLSFLLTLVTLYVNHLVLKANFRARINA